MPKNQGVGQAAIIKNATLKRLTNHLSQPYYTLFWIALYTGERWGAILQLKVKDVYHDDGRIRTHITYRKQTRKKAAGKEAKTRQVPIVPRLKDFLYDFSHSDNPDDWLFPGCGKSGHLTRQACDRVLRKACRAAGYADKGIALHSTRRTFITKMSKKLAVKDLQHLTGHASLSSLLLYIEQDQDALEKAMLDLEY